MVVMVFISWNGPESFNTRVHSFFCMIPILIYIKVKHFKNRCNILDKGLIMHDELKWNLGSHTSWNSSYFFLNQYSCSAHEFCASMYLMPLFYWSMFLSINSAMGYVTRKIKFLYNYEHIRLFKTKLSTVKDWKHIFDKSKTKYKW